MAKTIVGSFDSFKEAREVMQELQQRGFAQGDISIVANNVTGQYGNEGQLPGDAPTTLADTGTGAATGATAGGILGGAAGLIVGLAGLAIPGIGPIIAAGPLAATLAGAGVGAVTGGLIGGLTGAGVPEEEAHVYAEAVRRGGALVTVRAEDARADEAAGVMRQRGAVDVDRRAEIWRGQGWQGYDPTAKPYSAEMLESERAAYAAALGSTAPRTQTDLGGRPTPTSMGDGGWREHVDHFRMDHVENYGTVDFDEFEPAYHYGWDMGGKSRYRDRPWNVVEPELRRDWQQRYPDGAWERFKHAVRRGWERASETIERAIPGDSDHDGR